MQRTKISVQYQIDFCQIYNPMKENHSLVFKMIRFKLFHTLVDEKMGFGVKVGDWDMTKLSSRYFEVIIDKITGMSTFVE